MIVRDDAVLYHCQENPSSQALGREQIDQIDTLLRASHNMGHRYGLVRGTIFCGQSRTNGSNTFVIVMSLEAVLTGYERKTYLIKQDTTVLDLLHWTFSVSMPHPSRTPCHARSPMNVAMQSLVYRSTGARTQNSALLENVTAFAADIEQFLSHRVSDEWTSDNLGDCVSLPFPFQRSVVETGRRRLHRAGKPGMVSSLEEARYAKDKECQQQVLVDRRST